MPHNESEKFFDSLSNIIQNKELVRLILSKKRSKTSDLKSVIITIVKLKRGYFLNFVFRHNTKDITKNYDFNEGISLIKSTFEESFYSIEIFTTDKILNLISNEKGTIHTKVKKIQQETLPTFEHDKQKERVIKVEENIYLYELGISNEKGEIKREMTDKYRQINKYIELLAPELKELNDEKFLHIFDMGSGKGYLTFALYDYLLHNRNEKFSITGIEFREELVNICNNVAEKAEFNNLKFAQGTIEHIELEQVNVLIALHACNTATDDAIFRGIKAEAELIVCAPCCHKQIRKEMNPENQLASITKFGILKERQAEIITDAIRALILEAYGYKTKVFEFISTEHTPKNLMIIGRKIKEAAPINKELIFNNIASIKNLFGIKQHYLETLLAGEKAI